MCLITDVTSSSASVSSEQKDTYSQRGCVKHLLDSSLLKDDVSNRTPRKCVVMSYDDYVVIES